MTALALFFSLLVGLLHLYFMILEMFYWTKPKGIKTFGLASKDFAESTKVLAANQGLYNGFLAAGIFIGVIGNYKGLILFVLGCVIIAGIYGAYSTGKIRIFLIQSVPALIAMVFTLLNLKT